jgi:hypothetical protein
VTDTRDLEARLRWAGTDVLLVLRQDAADALAAQRAEIERLHAEQTRLRSVIEVLTDGGDVRVATDLWQRAKDAEAQLAEAQGQADAMRDLLLQAKETLGDWEDGQTPHTHYCPNCDNSIDGNRRLRDAIDAATRKKP